jgi:hypothetical protein
MIGLVRLLVVTFVIQILIYLYLSFRQRWRRRNRLEKEFDAGGKEGDRDAYIDKGLAEYQTSLKRRLIFGVLVVPQLLVILMIYVTNFK